MNDMITNESNQATATKLEKFRTVFEVIGIFGALISVILLYQANQQQYEANQQQLERSRAEIQAIQKQSSEEVKVLQAQIELQQKIYNDTRSAELLETIYGRRDCGAESIEVCPHVSILRVRAEAAKSLAQIEQESEGQLDLSDVNLSGASLIEGNLGGAILSHSDLSKANLSGADLNEAILSEANLSGADLSEASLVGTDLSETELKGAKYNFSTRWPEGFDPIAAGAVLVEE